MKTKLYSFFEKQKYDHEEILQILRDLEFEKYEYTYGLEYRNPTISHVPITKEKAIEYVQKDGFVDVDLIDNNTIHINEFSCNDMW